MSFNVTLKSVIALVDFASMFAIVEETVPTFISAVVTVKPTVSVYPVPWLLTAIELISPLVLSVAVAVAFAPSPVILITGNSKYLWSVSKTSILSITPVVSSGKANVNNCGSCTKSDLTSASSTLWSFSKSPKEPTLRAHSS